MVDYRRNFDKNVVYLPTFQSDEPRACDIDAASALGLDAYSDETKASMCTTLGKLCANIMHHSPGTRLELPPRWFRTIAESQSNITVELANESQPGLYRVTGYALKCVLLPGAE